VFSIRVQDDNGNASERKYKLNTPIVRRVYGPGEEPVRAASRKAVSKKAVSKKPVSRKAKRKR
jgi:ribosomal protein L25 (general stress protein Ctc)